VTPQRGEDLLHNLFGLRRAYQVRGEYIHLAPVPPVQGLECGRITSRHPRHERLVARPAIGRDPARAEN
jgi:hypothetical protein